MRKSFRKAILALALGAGLGAVALLVFFPALRGALCPSCYGLEQVSSELFVEAEMPLHARLALLREVAQARGQIEAALGPARAHLRILACQSDACDRRLGGRGAAAVTYSLGPISVVRLAPRGLSLTILTHELTHTETHARMGALGQLRGRMPTWMDEGVAVIVSNDPRYLGPGQGAERCLKRPRATLPVSPFIWGPLAGQDRDIYAEAACATLMWMDKNGGASALWARLDAAEPLP
ncbi:hypothetical protein C8J27_10656 [Rhodobacter aestuarii]|uniref:Peptidase MA superfamily protein n=1 Tax=Rhodobacter aestuarii TaxID=453582 RepID=A0A1N7M251_9RHOB|nr:hypothetical protein [Rhodobacter aestuarii]PTV94788.1 hypothetical protein C8J27_10656 [Rhodobacter aestuarii]SIS80069.1 hypothetical protein SAMN05421580_10556 [Rhodobacter aestuarii]